MIERVAISVRHGTVSSLEIRVPPSVADQWELIDRPEVEQRGAGPRGGRIDSAFVSRSLGRSTIRPSSGSAIVFRWLPTLESMTAREVTIPKITIKDGDADPARVLLALSPEIVVVEFAPGWVRAWDEGRVEPLGEGPYRSVYRRQITASGGRRFSFKARALEKVAMPVLVVPRLLIRTSQGPVAPGERPFVTGSSRTVPTFLSRLPKGTSWWKLALTDGSLNEWILINRSPNIGCGFPAMRSMRPALVELDLQESPRRIRLQAGGFRSSGTAESCFRLSGRCACRGAWRWSGSHGVGATRIDGAGPVFTGSEVLENKPPDRTSGFWEQQASASAIDDFIEPGGGLIRIDIYSVAVDSQPSLALGSFPVRGLSVFVRVSR